MYIICKHPARVAARVATVAVMTVAAIAFAFPFIWMLCGIFKTNEEIWRTPYRLLPSALDIGAIPGRIAGLGLGGAILNSLWVGGVGATLTIAVSALFAYATVFLRTRWTDALFAVVLVTYMLPGAVTYVPSYVVLARTGLLDTHFGLIVSYLANVFSVFYLRQSFMRINRDFVDAARIDGSSEPGILWRVVTPLCASSLSAIGMLTFIGLYNSYMWPAIMITSPEKFLIAQALRQFFIQDGAYGMNWNQVMLASSMAMLPLVLIFLLVRERFLSSIAEDSGVKS